MDTSDKKVCLITGGSGFVGNALAQQLISSGYTVYSLDDYSTSKTHESFSHFQKCPGTLELTLNGIHYIQGHTSEIATKCCHISPDIIFHFGEYSLINQSWSECDKVMKSNLYGTSCVLDYCLKKKALLVYSASSAILGETIQRTPYTFTKKVMVDLIKRYHEWFGLQYIITYFYNVYGEGQISNGPYATVLGIFEKQYSEGKSLTVVKPGTQSRCFTHINDIINGIITAISTFDNADVPICSKDFITIEDLARLFSDTIEYLPERQGDRESSKLELPDILRQIGWESSVNLMDYIEDVKNKLLSLRHTK